MKREREREKERRVRCFRRVRFTTFVESATHNKHQGTVETKTLPEKHSIPTVYRIMVDLGVKDTIFK